MNRNPILARTVQFLLNRLSNRHGALKPDARRRIEKMIFEPTEATWRLAKTIIIRPRHYAGSFAGLTLWQAVVHLNPSFRYTMPHREAVLAALLFAAPSGLRRM